MSALGAALWWVALTAAPGRGPEPRGVACSGEYADVLSAMSPAVRALEGAAGAGSTYLLRNVATYEHVYYGTGGKLRRKLVRHVRHGTAFAFRAEGGLSYLATNQHVAEHPVVTTAEDEVEGVPAGSRKVRETVRIVSDEAAAEEDGPPALSLVLADEALDLAVFATTQPLAVMPYRIGRSSALRVGNAVLVRGYPLGVFAAVNAGHVTSTGQADRERAWNHEDFAVDALLNSGNSGSPVFAVSCRTGELELVGIYHAGYKDAQALNVVVAIDQLRPTLETLRRVERRPERAEALDRQSLLARVRATAQPFVMPFADRVVRVEVEGDTVRFGLLDGDYPLTVHPEAELVDRGPDLSRPAALVPSPRGSRREVAWAGLDGVSRGAAERLHDALWAQLAAVLAFRDAEGRQGASGGGLAALAARIRAHRDEQREILQSVDFDVEGYARPGGVAAAARGASGSPAPDPAPGDE